MIDDLPYMNIIVKPGSKKLLQPIHESTILWVFIWLYAYFKSLGLWFMRIFLKESWFFFAHCLWRFAVKVKLADLRVTLFNVIKYILRSDHLPIPFNMRRLDQNFLLRLMASLCSIRRFKHIAFSEEFL